jgi:von Willebrand factor type A domain
LLYRFGMTRALVLGLVLLTAACGNKSFESLCANQVPPPAACNTACDPTPGAQTNCPGSFHCSTDGKCDTFCTQGGSECGDGYSCTPDGFCVSKGGGSDVPPDMNCPAVHFTATKTTPSIQILIDRSGSMDHNFADKTAAAGEPKKYPTVRDSLVGTQGVITQLDQQVYFGASLYSDTAPCPTLSTVTRAKGTRAAIETLINSQNPGGNTPTPPSIDKAVAEFAANPPPAGSPAIIVLATDGLPNKCGDNTVSTQTESVAAAKAAYAAGIKLYVLSVGDTAGTAAHFQALANAGQGVQAGQPNAAFYPASTPAQLSAAFQTIIGGVLSCDLKLSGQVDATGGQSGTVSLNGTNLTYGVDWTLDADGLTIHLLGGACNTLKTTANPVVDALFACGAVIY